MSAAFMLACLQQAAAQTLAPLWQTTVRETGKATGYLGSFSINNMRNAMSIDGAGNIFVTGYNQNYGRQSDTLTVKYSSAGSLLWRATDSPDGSGTYTMGISAKTTSDGGVVVSGKYSSIPAVLVVKYDSSGAQLWRNKLQFATLPSEPVMILDASGNILFATSVADAINLYKFDSAGNETWHRVLSTPPGGGNTVIRLAADTAGNVFIGGISHISGGDSDLLVAKVDGSGVELWRQIVGGTYGGSDFLRALAVDAAGSVYVLGSTPAASDQSNWLTLKFNSAGVEQWRAVMATAAPSGGEPRDIVLDNAGNTFVVGERRDNTTNFNSGVTVKYDSSGSEVWRRIDNAAIAYTEQSLTAGALAPNGDIVVTGETRGTGTTINFHTIRYDTNGNEVFRVVTSLPDYSDVPAAIAVDGNGEIVVAGNAATHSNHDFLTIKYSAAGAELWRANEGLDHNLYTSTVAVAADAAGNTYIAGLAYEGISGTDYLVAKIDASGVTQWQRRLRGKADTANRLTAMAIDGNGDILVTGLADNGERVFTARNYVTLKYSPAGVELWRAVADGAGNEEQATAIAVDGGNNVYVTGWSRTAAGARQGLTVKYNSAGAEIWRRIFAYSDDLPQYVGVDRDNNIIVAGYTYGAVGSGYSDRCFAVKYRQDGSEVWRVIEPGPGPVCLGGIDGAGNVYLAAIQYFSSSPTRVVVVKFDSSGNRQWGRQVVTTPTSYDEITGISVDRAGNAYLSMHSNFSSDNSALIVKLNESGLEQWRDSIPNVSMYFASFSRAPLVDSDGSVYVGGTSTLNGVTGPLAIKYSSNGSQLWRFEPGNVPNTINNVDAIALSGSDTVILAGPRDNFATAAKLSQAGTPSVPVLLSTVSRKTHGTAGIFDLALATYPFASLSSSMSVEPRIADGSHRLVFRFSPSAVLTSPGIATARDVAGNVIGTALTSMGFGSEILVDLTMPDNQRVIVTLAGVNGMFDYALPVSFHAGNFNGLSGNSQIAANSAVNAADISMTRARLQLYNGQFVTPANFLFDFDLSGKIDSGDLGVVKRGSGQHLR